MGKISIWTPILELEKYSWIRGEDYAKAKTPRDIPQLTPEFYIEKLKLKNGKK